MPRWGCDTLQRVIEEHGDELANAPLSRSSDEAAGSDCSAWPARDIVAKLVESADILLDAHDYDGHGWELVHEARAHAREWLSQNKEIGTKAANEQQHVHPMTLRECMEAEEPKESAP